MDAQLLDGGSDAAEEMKSDPGKRTPRRPPAAPVNGADPSLLPGPEKGGDERKGGRLATPTGRLATPTTCVGSSTRPSTPATQPEMLHLVLDDDLATPAASASQLSVFSNTESVLAAAQAAERAGLARLGTPRARLAMD